jgi:pimeloyl-ACP methyl ester carboxylesterase
VNRVLFLGAVVVGAAAKAAEKPAVASFDAKGVKIRYVVQGAGEPVVLIHGLHASAFINWQAPGIFDALAKEHRVVALDLPGHGGSDKPDDEAAYGVQMVEDVILLLDHLKIEKAHIVGYSLGGMIALKLVALHPDRVRSVVLGGMGWMQEGSRLQDVWEKLPAQGASRTPAVCVKSIGKLAVTADALKAIRVPVIVLVGDRDPVKRLYVAPLQAARPDWPVVEIEDAGHLNCIVKKEFATEIAQWLDKSRKH